VAQVPDRGLHRLAHGPRPESELADRPARREVPVVARGLDLLATQRHRQGQRLPGAGGADQDRRRQLEGAAGLAVGLAGEREELAMAEVAVLAREDVATPAHA